MVVAGDPADVLAVKGLLRRSPLVDATVEATQSIGEAISTSQVERFDAMVCVVGGSDDRVSLQRSLKALPDMPVVVVSDDAASSWSRVVETLGVQEFVPRSWLDCRTEGSELLVRALIGAIDRQALSRLEAESSRTLEAFMELFRDGLLVVSRDGTVARANRAAAELLGRHVADIERAGFPHDVKVLEPYEIKMRSEDGEDRLIEVTSVPGSWLGEPCYLVRLRPVASQSLDRVHAGGVAHPDAMTGLAPRESFLMRVDDLIAQRRSGDDADVAVLVIDLDQFKDVNENHGHAAGDMVLRQVAARISAVLPSGSALTRWAGDEFAAAVLTSHADPEEVAHHVASAIAQPYLVDRETVRCTATVGVARHHRDSPTARDLLEQAENAMCLGPESPDKVRILDPGTMTRGLGMLRLRADLRSAVADCDLWMVYQPIVSISGDDPELGEMEIIGLEALCRWEHPDHGLIPPLDFISVAEESGLVGTLRDWILRDVCEQIRAWREERPELVIPPVNINISPRQLTEPGLAEAVLAALRSNRLEPSAIRLEITEDSLLDVTGDAGEVLRKLTENGIDVQLDDFGTGYSSLSNLRRFPISTVKIDRSFVAGLQEDDQNREIVRAIIAMSAPLGIDCIAEGVENSQELAALRELGCEKAQGYLFDVPLPAAVAVDRFAAAASPFDRRLELSRAG